MGSDQTAVEWVESLLKRAITRQVSDIHFEPTDQGLCVRFRQDGLLQDADLLPSSTAESVVARLKVLAGLLTYRPDIPQEGSFTADPAWTGGQGMVDVRVATFPTVRGERAVVRLMYAMSHVNGLNELGLNNEMVADLRRAADRPSGLILITGPAGSGKSTTLYALARHMMATTPGRSVVSLEDPVERRIDGMAQIQISPHGELNYVRAMRSMLRQDVQVLLVGEIRDAETAHIVVEAALTGHLILSTMHSGDPAEAIVRLLEMGIAPYQLVGALTVVGSQRLLRVRCKACRTAGCDVCAKTGYAGRTACGQISVMNEPLRQAVLRTVPVDELRTLVARHHAPLDVDARRLVDAGLTTEAEALRVIGRIAPAVSGQNGRRSGVNHALV
jgi:type II secretory ATPase GspE/PulE/Tfp pilus assembly ATPase PilB-like protein